MPEFSPLLSGLAFLVPLGYALVAVTGLAESARAMRRSAHWRRWVWPL